MRSPNGFGDNAVTGDIVAQGVGQGLGILLFGLLGKQYHPSPFAGFAVTTVIFATLTLFFIPIVGA